MSISPCFFSIVLEVLSETMRKEENTNRKRTIGRLGVPDAF